MDEFLPVAILIPSLDRPQRLKETLLYIHANTPQPHRVLFCVADDASKAILDALGEWYLDDSDCDDHRYVTRMNKLIGHIGDAKSVFFGSDDVIHHEGWFEAAAEVMAEGYAVVVVNDDHNINGTQALVRADYIAEAVVGMPGLAFFPDYEHNFADTEMFYTAWMKGQHARAYDSHVEHLHPTFGSANSISWDQTYGNAMKGFWRDEKRFNERILVINEALGGAA